jgi:hypothetical protein
MLGGMDHQPSSTLQRLFVAAALATDQAERLRASLEDHASVLPADFLQEFEALVTQLRDLRDDLHDAGLDPDDDTALNRQQRPDSDRPPARLQDAPLDPDGQ